MEGLRAALAEKQKFDTLEGMAASDRLLYSFLHGPATRYAAEQRDLAKSIAELRELDDDATTS